MTSCAKNQQETDEICGTHNQAKRLGVFHTDIKVNKDKVSKLPKKLG